jgi:hypothetical protein
VTRLVGIILSSDVVTNYLAIRVPHDPVTEPGLVIHSKNVVVGYQSPSAKCLSPSFLYHANIFIWNKIFHGSGQNHCLMGPYDASVLYFVLWKRKLKTFGDWDGQDIGSDPDADIASGRISSVCKVRPSFKFKIGLSWLSALLKEIDSANGDRKVGAQNSFVALPNFRSDIFHSISGSSGLGDVTLHCVGLFSGGFDGFSELSRLVCIYDQLKEGNKRENSRELDQVPIVVRFAVSIFLLLEGFFGSLRGWKHPDNNRGFLGTTLICGSSLLGLLSFVFWLL